MIEVAETIPLWSLWWVWMAAALLLAVIEIVLPAFMALGFAIGAALVGLMLVFAPMALGLSALLAMFAVLSLVSWAVLRRIFRLADGQGLLGLRQCGKRLYLCPNRFK
jgi:membrane protein implicated in regulation of membrane protease activity